MSIVFVCWTAQCSLFSSEITVTVYFFPFHSVPHTLLHIKQFIFPICLQCSTFCSIFLFISFLLPTDTFHPFVLFTFLSEDCFPPVLSWFIFIQQSAFPLYYRICIGSPCVFSDLQDCHLCFLCSVVQSSVLNFMSYPSVYPEYIGPQYLIFIFLPNHLLSEDCFPPVLSWFIFIPQSVFGFGLPLYLYITGFAVLHVVKTCVFSDMWYCQLCFLCSVVLSSVLLSYPAYITPQYLIFLFFYQIPFNSILL